MKDYLKKSKKYWEKENYDVDNVEGYVFRVYGRILESESKKEGNLLDWGCGSGANLRYMRSKGLNVFGVDSSAEDIKRCKQKMPGIKDNFKVIEPQPSLGMDYFNGTKFDVIMATQSLYYLDNEDLKIQLELFDKLLSEDGLVFFTMMSKDSEMFYDNAEYDKDGLWKVEYDYPRHRIKDYRMQLLSKKELIEKFGIFEPLHIGFYSEKFRENEPMTHHWIFVGKSRMKEVK